MSDEPCCDDCGLPISICNARAMLRKAIKRHGIIAVGRKISDLLMFGDGVTDDAIAFKLGSRS